MRKNNKTKAVKHINVLNLFLILALFSVVIGYLMIFLNDIYSFDGGESLNIDEFEMEIRIEDVCEDEITAFETGDRLVIKNANTVLGTLSDIENVEERNETVLYLKVVGTYTTDTGFKLNGKSNLALGDLIELEGITETAEIVSIHAVK